MNTIKVEKQRLLDTLMTNKAKHRETFEKAQEKYREAVIKQLDERLAAARDGRKIDLMFRLPEPKDYTEEYETAIAMLDWETGDTVELEQDDFERYVLDQWNWKGVFAATNATYGV